MSAIKKNIIRRFIVIYIIVVMAFVAVIAQVIYVQHVEGDYWREASRQNIRENITVRANRGNIYSAGGQLMASSIPEYTLFMDFVVLPRETLYRYVDTLAYLLSKTLQDKTPAQYRQSLLDGHRRQSRRHRISNRTATYIQFQEIKQFPLFRQGRYRSGFYTEYRFRRVRPFGSLAARTIGNIYGESGRGNSGLEMFYNDILMGRDGLSTRQRIAGERIRINEVDPINGLDIITTIDIEMQDIAENALRNQLTALNAQAGCVILMEVRTGKIRAIANLVRGRDGVYRESRNLAFSSMAEPGSTFKTASLMAALEENVIRATDSIDTYDGRFRFGTTIMRDHNHARGGFGKISITQALAYSSNIAVARIINENFRTRPEQFVNRLYNMSLNQRVDFEIPGSGRPIIPHPRNENQWRVGDHTMLPWLSIGYNSQIPPIYTLQFYNAIANGGRMVKPMLVQAFSRNGNIVREFRTETINPSIASRSTINAIIPMLEETVISGTARAARSNLFRTAGKTGTTQIGYGVGNQQEITHMLSFSGFFPVDNPQYSMIVVIKEPNVGHTPSSGATAGRVFREIAERVYARTAYILPANREIDSMVVRFPESKSGNNQRLQAVLAGLGFATYNVESEWVRTSATLEGLLKTPIDLCDESVPNVVGMGAKDAVFLLESLGLRVQLNGVGTIRRQSIAAGSAARRGQTITLTLR